MRSEATKWLVSILALLMPLWGCGDDEVTGPGDGMTALSVYLTDATGDVEAVWVEILGISAQGGEGGPVDLLGEPTDLIPLTDLVGTTQLLVANAELEAATYSQLRLVVGDAVLQSTEGVVYVKGDPTLPEGLDELPRGELQCPSCSQSGLKVKIPNDELEMEEGAVALVLDFDVALSFGHKAGNSGKWVMHPVIQGTLVGDQDGDGDVGDELGTVNAVRGTVALATGVEIPACPEGSPRSLTDFIPTATLVGIVDGDGQPIVRTGTVATDGTFQIGFLASGSYDLGYVGALVLDDHQLIFGASVIPTQAMMDGADVEGVAYTIESATCGAIP